MKLGYKNGLESLKRDTEKQIREHRRQNKELMRKNQYLELFKRRVKVELDLGELSFNEELGIKVIV